MNARQPRYSNEEFARRGNEWYDTKVRAQVETDHEREFVAIDIETGAFEVAATALAATKQLIARLPDAQPWCIRIGRGPVRRFGAHSNRMSV